MFLQLKDLRRHEEIFYTESKARQYAKALLEDNLIFLSAIYFS